MAGAVKGGEGLTKVVNQPNGTRDVSFDIDLPSDAAGVSAKAYYVTEKMTYAGGQPDQEFKTCDLKTEGNRIMGKLPKEACSFYVEIKTTAGGKDYYTATAFMDVVSEPPHGTGSGSGSRAWVVMAVIAAGAFAAITMVPFRKKVKLVIL